MKLHDVILKEMESLSGEIGRYQTAETDMRKYGTLIRKAEFSLKTKKEIARKIARIKRGIPKFPDTKRCRRYLLFLCQEICAKKKVEKVRRKEPSNCLKNMVGK